MFRDTFYDCEEGDTTKDMVLKRPLRQMSLHAPLLMTKTPCIAIQRGQRQLANGNFRGLGPPRTPTTPGMPSFPQTPFPSGTVKECELGSPGSEARWSKGDGTGFMVRSLGYDGNKRLDKEMSIGSLYECTSVDTIKADEQIKRVIGTLAQLETVCDSRTPWTYPLPRVLCVNVQLPYRSGFPMWAHPKDDPGCNVVAIFRIKQETVDLLNEHQAGKKQLPEGVRLFLEFVRGGTTDLPNPGPRRSGLFKAIATCTNADEVADGIPAMLRKTALKQNGKPALITQSGSVFADPNGEWMEIGVDVRRFCFAAKEVLVQLRDRLVKASVHIGFLIQGVGDDLPEGIICDCHLHCIDLERDPVHVEIPSQEVIHG